MRLRHPGPRLAAAALAPVLAMTGLALAAPARAASCPSSGGVHVPEADASGEVVFRGHGWGHGLGMSQYGAQGAARLGCSASDILTRYYAGSKVATASMPDQVLLRMLNNGYRVDIVAQTGAVTWDLQGCSVGAAGCPPKQPKGAFWQLRLDGTGTSYVLRDPALPAGSQVVWQGGSPDQKLRLRHSGTVVHETTWKGSSIYLDRRLKWDLTRFAIDTSGSGTQRLDAVQLINDTSTGSAMDKYLWGIAEVPVSWTNGAHEALKAQAIAARTYAAKRAGKVLMPTPADQNYTGYAKEAEDAGFTDSDGHNLRWKAAVDSTSRQVVRSASGGGLIDTFYSSSVGGYTEDERYVWGPDTPSLRMVDDSRWEMASSNPAAYRSWAEGFSLAKIASTFGFQSVTAVSVPRRGAAGRVAGVKITGFRSGKLVSTYVDGWDVRQALGLRSPGFEISVRAIGGPGAVPVVGDWDGDGSTDLGWWKAGKVALQVTDDTGTWTKRFWFGRAGDVPVVGDWDGDGVDDVGVFRNGTWYLRNGTSGPTTRSFVFGTKGDRPVVGSWNGTDLGIGVVRKGRWLLRDTVTPGAPARRFYYGRSTDLPVVGDYDGDGRSTPGIRRNKRFYLHDTLTSGAADHIYTYGLASDRVLTGDWDGDGRTTLGFVRDRTFSLRDLPRGGAPTSVVVFSG